MTDVFNFSAGPAVLPGPVLVQAQQELRDWQGSGMSVMEMSHRGSHFMSIAQQAESDLRSLLSIPDEYRVLFLQGGATSQFAMVPMNLLRGKDRADYINTGAWSKKAIAEAGRYCTVNVAATAEASNFSDIPARETWQLDAAAAYVHYTPNETIGGVEFSWIPDTGAVPLVADMSSTILSRPLDISRYGLIYAGAQKNIGPAGLTVVIVRDELLGDMLEGAPTMYNYRLHADAGSMLNTPPTFGWYLAGLVFRWLRGLGGLEAIETINRRKAARLYEAIDGSDFYHSPVRQDCRSLMNVPFTLTDSSLDGDFLAAAGEAGLLNLKGHRSVGGMRASIYNAMPEAGVAALVEFMREFERSHG